MAAYEAWTVETAFATVPDDTSPLYVDVTSRVDTVEEPIRIHRGREGAFDTIQPSTCELVFDNPDHRFTPGNASSPYSPYVRQARRIRISETVGGTTYRRFTGYWELPEVDDWAESGADQQMTVSATDRRARLNRSREGVSTLGEHILFNASGCLLAYWPLNDPAGSLCALEMSGNDVGPLVRQDKWISQPTAGVPDDLVSFGAMPGPPGDDSSYVEFNAPMDVAGTSPTVEGRLVLSGMSLGMPRTGYFAVSLWVNLDGTATAAGVLLYVTGPSFAAPNIILQYDPTNISAFVSAPVGSTTVAGPAPALGKWQLVTVRIGTSAGDISLWVDGNLAASGSLGGAVTGTFTDLLLESPSPNTGFGHLQFYAGKSAVITSTLHTAQISAAYTGLEWQSTGTRIAQLAYYAGIGSGLTTIIDTFARTVAAGGWGSADTGQAWTVSATATDFSVTPGAARLAISAATSSRLATLATSLDDVEFTGTLTPAVVATGAAAVLGPVFRYFDSLDFYSLRLNLRTTAAVDLDLVVTVGGVETVLASATNVITYGAGTSISYRVVTVGSQIRARVWLTSAAEPTVWHVAANDISLTGAAALGMRGRLDAGNTNTLPYVVTFGPIRAIGKPSAIAPTVSLSTTELALDAGASVMSTAALEGRSHGSGMDDAVSTEQGRLFAAGDGTLVFHGRERILTPQTPTSIPYTWITQPLAFRTDPPINTASVTRSAGGVARYTNATSQAEYGTYSATADIHSAQPDDAQALARWLAGAYADPRPRCPTLTLDLLPRTVAEQQTILAREIGDWVTITGAPSAWPTAALTMVIEGITDTIGEDVRIVAWNLAATPGTWFTDGSVSDTGDPLAY